MGDVLGISIVVMEPDAVSRFTEAGVYFLLMDRAALQRETGLMGGVKSL